MSVENEICDCVTTSAASGPTSTLTLQDVIAMLKRIPPEPFAEYMRSEGCPPEEGWHLFLPIDTFNELGGALRLPRYVKPNRLTETPMLLRMPVIGYGSPWPQP